MPRLLTVNKKTYLVEDNPLKWSKGVKLKSGKLTKTGYSIHESEEKRHAALAKGVARDGYAAVVRRLLFIANVAGKFNSETKKKAQADIKWLHGRYGA